MKRYEYAELDINGFLGLGAGTREHRAIIDEYAAKGYRYAGFLPTAITDHGKIRTMDLIFEKEDGPLDKS